MIKYLILSNHRLFLIWKKYATMRTRIRSNKSFGLRRSKIFTRVLKQRRNTPVIIMHSLIGIKGRMVGSRRYKKVI